MISDVGPCVARRHTALAHPDPGGSGCCPSLPTSRFCGPLHGINGEAGCGVAPGSEVNGLVDSIVTLAAAWTRPPVGACCAMEQGPKSFAIM